MTPWQRQPCEAPGHQPCALCCDCRFCVGVREREAARVVAMVCLLSRKDDLCQTERSASPAGVAKPWPN